MTSYLRSPCVFELIRLRYWCKSIDQWITWGLTCISFLTCTHDFVTLVFRLMTLPYLSTYVLLRCIQKSLNSVRSFSVAVQQNTSTCIHVCTTFITLVPNDVDNYIHRFHSMEECYPVGFYSFFMFGVTYSMSSILQHPEGKRETISLWCQLVTLVFCVASWFDIWLYFWNRCISLGAEKTHTAQIN